MGPLGPGEAGREVVGDRSVVRPAYPMVIACLNLNRPEWTDCECRAAPNGVRRPLMFGSVDPVLRGFESRLSNWKASSS